MGWAIDTFGQTDSMATIFGTALTALGAVPVAQPGHDPENLTAGMLVVIPALVISGTVLLAGSRHLPREMALMLAKLRATPSRLRPIRPGSTLKRVSAHNVSSGIARPRLGPRQSADFDGPDGLRR